MELGAFSAFFYMIKAREILYDLIENVTGARIMPNYIRIGGLKSANPWHGNDPMSSSSNERSHHSTALTRSCRLIWPDRARQHTRVTSHRLYPPRPFWCEQAPSSLRSRALIGLLIDRL